MRNLLLIIVVALFMSTQAQAQLETVNESLAQRVGENTSLYDAVCMLNDIVPGSIGMTEGRVLMAEYAEMIGLNYRLYLKNGGNNLHILHYTTSWEVMTKDADVTEVDEACSTCGNHNAQDRTVGIDADADADAEVSDYYFQDEATMADIDVVDTVTIVDTVVLTRIVTETRLQIVTDTVEHEYCDCEGLSVKDAWTQHDLLRDEWKNEGAQSNKAINAACRAKLRRYIKYAEKMNYDLTHSVRSVVPVVDGRWEVPMIGIITISMTGTEPEVKKAPRKRKARKIGKGRSRGKGNGFWSKLFPYANC